MPSTPTSTSGYAARLFNGIIAVSRKNEQDDTYNISQEALQDLINNMDRPRRPASSFIIFKTKNKDKFKEMFPDTNKAGDMAKRVAEYYANLSDSEKAPYEEEYLTLKNEYLEKMKLHKKFFPDIEDEKPKRKRGRPRKNITESEITEKKENKKRGRKPKAPKHDKPIQRVDTSDSDSDSDNDDCGAEFTVIKDNKTGISYSVDLVSGLYFDVNAPWGKSLGVYDKEKGEFN